MDESKQDRRNTKEPKFRHLDGQTANAVSSTDCTGLIPANPREEDMEEYTDILGFESDVPEE